MFFLSLSKNAIVLIKNLRQVQTDKRLEHCYYKEIIEIENNIF